MSSVLIELWADDGGATAIEYAMVAGFISVVIVAIVNNIGAGIAGIFAAVNAGF